VLEWKVRSNLMHIAISSDKIDLSSENKTEELSKKILKSLKPGNVVFFYGEIGVGKTTFIRYLINAFQKENSLDLTEITSPTFNILNEYKIKKINIKHYDLFRLKSLDEIKNLDLFEDNLNSIILIEWPELIKKKPKNLIEIYFKYEEDYKKRSVQINGLNF
jgi:tRNA threonylcarbamoyladenosine biosynthesis protein TsaE